MRSVENIAEELFDKIRSRVDSIKLGDTDGNTTIDPTQTRFFEFNFKHREMPIGAVTISLNEEGKLQVYFPNSIVDETGSSTANAWYGFLKELSRFSARNMLNYETHNVTKERLDKKDYQFLTQRNQDEVMENKLHGTSQKSFLEQGTAKLIIQHNKTVDETKMGARSRNISAIYIENSEGERFKFANNYLPGARAMARHVSNEGHTRDDRGHHIVEIMDEMNNLKQFVRSVKSEEYVNEDAQEVIGAATDRYYGLKDTLKAVSSAKGYADYFENWVPGAVEVEENDINDLKAKLTRSVFDDRITDTLPSVSRAMSHKKASMEAKKDDEEELDAPIKPYFDRSIDPQEPKNLDAKADANTASSEQALAAIVNGSTPLVIRDTEDKQEIQNYLQFMKSSTMDTTKKNKNMIVNIIEYLANNMADDNAARAVSNLDMGIPQHEKMAMALSVMFLKGKAEYQVPKAKKDIKGKDKTEDTTFEAYAQRMDMIAEGTWALPENESEAMKIAAMMANPIALGDGGDDAANALGGLLGDDELFDDLGVAGDKDPEGDARGIIIGWMMEHVDDYGDKYQETMRAALDKIRADGNDSGITIPRTFGAQQDRAYNTSSTQGERMGSNADDMKEDPNEGNEFSGALAQAKKDGKDEFEVDGKKYKVSEADYDLSTLDGKYGNMPVKGKEGILQTNVEDDVNDIAATMEEDPELENFAMAFEKSVYASGDTSPEGIRAALEEVLPDYIAGSRIEDLMKVIESTNEGRMSDINIEIQDMVADGASNDEIKKAIPMATDRVIADIRSEMDESVQFEEVQEVDEAAEMIAKIRSMAGVGSGAKSNHGIHEGEEGYQLTPRSIVARQMRKLQDIEKN